MVANLNQHTGQDNPIQSPADTFKRVAETRRQVQSVAQSAREAIETFYTDPHGLAAFIESYGTPVYVLHGGKWSLALLKLLGFDPGFILPREGWRFNALKRVLALHDRLNPKAAQNKPLRHPLTHGFFVMTRPLFTLGFLSHQLHHWLAYRSGMTGYSERAQMLYKKFWAENHGVIGPEVSKMSAEDILALKAAINRDLEALKFLKAIANEVLIPAQQARRIGHGTASA